ncbi:MAG: hypothetical protein M0R46_13230 [Candidatus Muirbacterium halophilum]|nr:hypothetical protein [Candidatus Muirbacterium halophilum]
MIILRARLKPNGMSVEYTSIKGKIKSLIEKNKNNKEVFEFVIKENKNNYISCKTYGYENINPDLIGKTIPIIDDVYNAVFNEDGTIDILINKK